MNINEYQKEAVKTAMYGSGLKIVYPTLGLAGEAGEVADKVKKVIRDHNGEFSEELKLEIAKELGDVLWYCANISHDMGFTLDTIAKLNIEKIQSRRERNQISGSGDNR